MNVTENYNKIQKNLANKLRKIELRKELKQQSMNKYTSKVITRSDGTKYVQCTQVPSQEQVWTEYQQQVSNWLDKMQCSKD